MSSWAFLNPVSQLFTWASHSCLLSIPSPGTVRLNLQFRCQVMSGHPQQVNANQDLLNPPNTPYCHPQVLTVDARNHGNSPHSPDMSYEAMSQDLQGLLPQLGLAPCVLVGHSMGGKTAMLLALQKVSHLQAGVSS